MSRDALIARGRATAEAGMVDACTIRRVTSTSSNSDTGVTSKTYDSSDPYSGKCRIQQPQAQARPHDVGEDYLLISRLEIQLPVATSGGLLVGDEVTITAAARDADLVGRTFLVQELPRKTDATARRIQVIERTN